MKHSRSSAEADSAHLVTFALFTYNQSQFVEQAARSALAQTYQPLRVILSDDCSSDDTFERLSELARTYQGPHELVVRRNESNLGLCGHVQAVADLADGHVLVVAAGDDYSEPDRVSKLVARYRADPTARLVYSSVRTFHTDEELLRRPGDADRDREPDVITMARYLAGEWFPVAGASASYDICLFRDFAPIPADAIYEDSILLFRALLRGHMVQLPEPLVSYRTHDGQVTNTHTADVRVNLVKRRRLAAAAVRVARQQLDDLLTARNSGYVQSIFRTRLYLLRRYWFYAVQEMAYRWSWPLGIPLFPILFVLRGRAKAALGMREFASIALPESIFLRVLNWRTKQRESAQ